MDENTQKKPPAPKLAFILTAAILLGVAGFYSALHFYFFPAWERAVVSSDTERQWHEREGRAGPPPEPSR